MCVTCHGAPGVEASEIGTGLYPAPPDLQAEAAEWSDTELYWTIANGIKMSGMPAFAPTHEPDELWSLVAFVKTLPNVTPETYRSMVAAAGLEMPTSAHRHGARSGERPARGPGGSDHPHP
jgi:mono/diheme cytochrome c family protein